MIEDQTSGDEMLGYNRDPDSEGLPSVDFRISRPDSVTFRGGAEGREIWRYLASDVEQINNYLAEVAEKFTVVFLLNTISTAGTVACERAVKAISKQVSETPEHKGVDIVWECPMANQRIYQSFERILNRTVSARAQTDGRVVFRHSEQTE